VVERAREVLANLERATLDMSGRPILSHHGGMTPPGQLSLFHPGAPSPLEEELRRLDLDHLSPLEALQVLYRLREMLRE
jgi:DNA mismatch repair protein MutS